MRIEKNIADELVARISPATLIRRDEPLAKHTTLRVGGPADVYVEPANEEDLANVINFVAKMESSFSFSAAARIYLCATAGFAAW